MSANRSEAWLAAREAKRIREGTGAGETVATRPTGRASPAPAQAHRQLATNVRSERPETDGRGPRQLAQGIDKQTAVRCAKSQKKAIPAPSEHAEQVAFFDWVRPYLKTCGIPPSLCYAVPNGSYLGADAKTRAIVMRKLKAAGLTPGVCDINLDWPKNYVSTIPPHIRPDGTRFQPLLDGHTIFHGLRIEMKRKPNKPEPEQAAHIAALRQAGYSVIVCWSFEDARRAVEAYLD